MNSQKIKIVLGTFAFLAVFYPVLVWYQNTNLSLDSTILFDVFPVLGLIAFSLMWLHIVGGVFRTWLKQHVDFKKFVSQTSVIVLILIILHPLLLLINLAPKQIVNIFTTGQPVYLWIAVVAWIIFIGYDIAKLFKTHKFLNKHWKTVKFISTLAFFLVLFHSLKLGGDLQSGPLRYLWLFYGVTAALATVYTYIVKDLTKKQS